MDANDITDYRGLVETLRDIDNAIDMVAKVYSILKDVYELANSADTGYDLREAVAQLIDDIAVVRERLDRVYDITSLYVDRHEDDIVYELKQTKFISIDDESD